MNQASPSLSLSLPALPLFLFPPSPSTLLPCEQVAELNERLRKLGCHRVFQRNRCLLKPNHRELYIYGTNSLRGEGVWVEWAG